MNTFFVNYNPASSCQMLGLRARNSQPICPIKRALPVEIRDMIYSSLAPIDQININCFEDLRNIFNPHDNYSICVDYLVDLFIDIVRGYIGIGTYNKEVPFDIPYMRNIVNIALSSELYIFHKINIGSVRLICQFALYYIDNIKYISDMPQLLEFCNSYITFTKAILRYLGYSTSLSVGDGENIFLYLYQVMIEIELIEEMYDIYHYIRPIDNNFVNSSLPYAHKVMESVANKTCDIIVYHEYSEKQLYKLYHINRKYITDISILFSYNDYYRYIISDREIEEDVLQIIEINGDVTALYNHITSSIDKDYTFLYKNPIINRALSDYCSDSDIELLQKKDTNHISP